jgi:hypothetical protein
MFARAEDVQCEKRRRPTTRSSRGWEDQRATASAHINRAAIDALDPRDREHPNCVEREAVRPIPCPVGDMKIGDSVCARR